jgi:hypothetical protein
VNDRADGVAEPEIDSVESQPRADVARSRLGYVSCFAIGMLAAVVGLLPWLFTGMRLPLQNLWATPAAPEAMPLALLPLSQYTVTLIPGLLVTGAAIAGLVMRITRTRQPRLGAMLIALGVLFVDTIAGVQASVVVANGLEQSAPADFYLLALIVVVLVSLAMAVAVLLLIGRAPVPGATIGMVVAALAVGIWLSALITPFGSPPTADEATFWFRQVAHQVAGWVPPILAGIALGWCGVRTVGRVLAVVAGLALLWIGPVATTAVSAATGTRILLQYPAEMLDYGLGVFRMALVMPELVLQPILIAIVVAVVWMVVRQVLRSRPGSPRRTGG